MKTVTSLRYWDIWGYLYLIVTGFDIYSTGEPGTTGVNPFKRTLMLDAILGCTCRMFDPDPEYIMMSNQAAATLHQIPTSLVPHSNRFLLSISFFCVEAPPSNKKQAGIRL